MAARQISFISVPTAPQLSRRFQNMKFEMSRKRTLVTPSSSSSTTDVKFLLFTKFPIEIQLLVWKYACDGAASRGLSLQFYERKPTFNLAIRAFHKHPIPPLLHASRTSRAEGLKHYSLIFGITCDDGTHQEATIYMNCEKDFLLMNSFEDWNVWMLYQSGFYGSVIDPEELCKARIAICLSTWQARELRCISLRMEMLAYRFKMMIILPREGIIDGLLERAELVLDEGHRIDDEPWKQWVNKEMAAWDEYRGLNEASIEFVAWKSTNEL